MDPVEANIDWAHKYHLAWSSSGDRIVSYASGRNGKGIRAENGTGVLRFSLPDFSTQTFIAGAALYPLANATSARGIFSTLDGETNQCGVVYNSDGAIAVRRNAVVLGTSSAGALTYGAWNYVEAKIKVASTGGTAEIRVNGVTVLNLTSQDTANTAWDGINSFCIGGYTAAYASFYGYMDDFYLCNNLGSYNNDFLGDVTIDCLMPASDSSPNTWTPSTGVSNYAVVDERGYAATEWTASNTVGNKTQFNMEDMAANPVGIKGAIVTTLSRRNGSGTNKYKAYISSGGSTQEATHYPAGAAEFRAYRMVSEVDPNGSVAWTKATINAAQVGLEVA